MGSVVSWFDNLSHKAKIAYIRMHPNSKYAKRMRMIDRNSTRDARKTRKTYYVVRREDSALRLAIKRLARRRGVA